MSATHGAHFVGYVVKEPQRKSDKAPWIIRIGVDGAGNNFDETGYFNVAAFDNQFGNLVPHLRPGTRLAIAANIRHRTYQDDSGNARSLQQYIAESIDIIRTGQAEAKGGEGKSGTAAKGAEKEAAVSADSGVEELFEGF